MLNYLTIKLILFRINRRTQPLRIPTASNKAKPTFLFLAIGTKLRPIVATCTSRRVLPGILAPSIIYISVSHGKQIKGMRVTKRRGPPFGLPLMHTAVSLSRIRLRTFACTKVGMKMVFRQAQRLSATKIPL